jgi:glyoxylase-like metal-dependent hydrolase (beta-lactamase superfamily II)
LSPEQWFDEGVDERADLYALGVTLYHMLSRRYPFEGQEPLEVAQRMMKHELLHLQVASPDIDPSLATLVHRAMARTPGQRFQTASEMADALSRWWSQHPPLVPNLTLDQPMPTAASSMVTRQPSRTRVQALGAEPRTGVYAAPLSGVTSHDFSAPRAPMGVALKRPQSGLQEVPMGPRLQQMQPQAAGAMRELAPNTYWVGKRTSPGAPPCNTYLRAFRAPSSGAQAFALINPCAGEDVEGLGAKLEPVMGGLDKLSLLFVGHPDPLVALTAAQLCAHLNDQAPLLASTQTWQQVGELGIRRGRFVAAEDYGRGMRLPTGHSLLPVAAAFCASAGAVMLYDPDTRVLFSGDLMSSLSPRDTLGPWADESDWSGVRAFHQRVMPCTQALRRVVAAVRKLSPAVSVVAPHRGRVVRGELVGLFLDRLEALTVGIESLDARLDDAAHLSDWDAVLQRVVSAAARALGSDALDALSADYILRDDLQPDPTSTSGWRVVRLGAATVARCLRLLTAAASPEVARQLRAEAERACKAQGLPPLPT